MSAEQAADSRGFVYVATGPGYVAEAMASASTLRNHHRDAAICLVTDVEPADRALFDEVVIRDDAEYQPIDKLLAVHSPFERTIFLDTDTRVCGDLSAMFDLLDAFDIGVLQDQNRGWDYTLPGVPDVFSEFNTGVIAFRRTNPVLEFFSDWRAEHTRLSRERGFVNDQPAFRSTLFRSRLRVAPLPSEFHFLGNVPNSLLWKVRLIHARGDLEAMARTIDESLGLRAYIPDVGVVSRFHGRRSWIRSTIRVTQRMLRLAIRPPADSAKGNPGKWWLGERRG